jgi:hypothetical protein
MYISNVEYVEQSGMNFTDVGNGEFFLDVLGVGLIYNTKAGSWQYGNIKRRGTFKQLIDFIEDIKKSKIKKPDIKQAIKESVDFLLYRKFIETCINKEMHINGKKERHHIIPKSLGGDNDKSNLVYVSTEDHREAHRLLVQCLNGTDYHEANKLMKYAYAKMSKKPKPDVDSLQKRVLELEEEVRVLTGCLDDAMETIENLRCR